MTKSEHLLACLSEEAGEVTQAVGKCLRFGMYDCPPNPEMLPNNEYLAKEVNDLLAVAELINASYGYSLSRVGNRPDIESKKAKLIDKWMPYAKQVGVLQDD